MPVRLSAEHLEEREVLAAAFQNLPILPFADAAVLDHARAIQSRGQTLGRKQDVVLKIGDSNSAPFYTPEYLAPLGAVGYNPFSSGLSARYGSLLDSWNAYRSGRGALAHEGPTAWPGWRTQNVLAALSNEIRAMNPAIALVMIGTNDAMLSGDSRIYRAQLTQLVDELLAAGVLPVLSTLPDSNYLNGRYRTTLRVFNQLIADVAGRKSIPLWNVWSTLNALPNRGLKIDGVHLNSSPNGAGSFWPADMLYAQNVRNLQALRILDWFRERVSGQLAFIAPELDWQPMSSGRHLYSVGRDAGVSPTVDVYDADSGELVNRFLAFNRIYGGGVRVATGDTNGDGFTDIICTTATGVGVVNVVSGADGSSLARFRPFGSARVTGFNAAVGDLDNDGSADIVVGRTGAGGAVRVYEGGSYNLSAQFQPLPQSVRSGVSLAVANVEEFGSVVVVGSGHSNATVRYFDSEGNLLSSFVAFGTPGRAISIATADLNDDGFDEIVVGRASGIDRLRIFDSANHALLSGIALGPAIDPAYGLRLGTMRSSTDDGDILLVGSAPGSSVAVRGYGDLTGIAELLPLERANRAFGIFVG